VSRSTVRANLVGLAFIAPNFLLMFVFVAYPVLFSIVLAFTNWDLVSGFGNIHFVGLSNFKEMLRDQWFLGALRNNVVYTLTVVPGSLLCGLLAAVAIQELALGKGGLRLLLFLPYISSIVAVSLVWSVLYSQFGPIIGLLRRMGIPNPPNFLGDPNWALPAIIVMSIWNALGYVALIYSAGLQGIPDELYEAARIDGASWVQKLAHVTIPGLKATTFFLVITQVISSFKVFAQIQVMTEGGPMGSTSVLAYYIYENAFRFYRFGYASAVSLVLFAIVIAFTMIQWRRQGTP
jgi:multiple sugar transport system permease protein